jgi:uncharacterized protein (TIGR03435 family)
VRTETNLRGGGVIVKTVNGKEVRTVYVDLPGGGVVWESRENAPGQVMTYYNATMKDLTDALNRSSGRIPVRDKTSLTSRYDFTIKRVPPLNPDENHVYSYSLEHLGLAVKPGTEQRPALVIDHIERPSAN